MSIMWKYLDKRKAVIDAMKDYSGMQFILEHTEESVRNEYQKMDSKAAIDSWNKGNVRVGLIHPASAGHGLNLQEGGSTIIWYSPVWSLELYQQTNGRLWRQGQKSQTVVIHHIITKGTIDEKIMQSLQKKDVTQNTLIEAVRATITGAAKGEERKP